MKRLLPFFVVFIMMFAILFSFGQAAKKGPIVDTILVDVRMQEDIGLKDTAEGKTDIFFWGVQGNVFKALPENVKSKLDVYRIPSGTWSININSYPHKAPYIAKVENKEQFNPFAIQKVRFALNWLINRKYIIDEILGGDGEPMFTMATPGQPGTYRYNLIASKLGMKATGDEAKAIKDITDALTEASNLPELKGKLVKKDNFWYFNNEPVTIKFLIRVDDPNGRLRSGRYIADQIEKAGIKVERLEWDRRKAITTSYYSNPADMKWHLYTEGWGAGSTRQWWELIIAQMYAPWYGYMPGGADPANWNYENAELDDLTKKLVNGQFATEQEYWDIALKSIEIALKEAMRIYICSQEQYYVVNKDKFIDRMAYGVGDGMNHWSLRTADIKPDRSGRKVLRMTEFSAKGALFMSSWDPIGVDGFADVYSRVLMEPMRDFGTFESPYSAETMMWRVKWDPKNIETKVVKDKDGNLVGQIPVPENAIWYNSATKKWEPVGKGKTSFSKGTYSFVYSKYHNGHQEKLADILYSIRFSVEWATKDGDNDKYYDDQYSSQIKPGLDIIKGIVINKDGTITTYFDYNWPMEKARVASAGAFWTPLTPWPIYEALADLVANGNAKSKTVYSFTAGGEGVVEPDLLNETCVQDILARLEEFKAKKYIPFGMESYINEKDAIVAYDLAINWIRKYNHAFISDGPFYLHKYDPKSNQMELRAYRDASYPYDPYYWKKLLVGMRMRINKITLPQTLDKNKPTTITVNVSVINYPKDTAVDADKGNVKAILVLPDGKEKVYIGKFTAKGVFTITIPAGDTKELSAGSYVLVIEAQYGNEAPAVETTFLVFF